MARLRSGQLNNEHALQPIRRPTKRSGVSSGCQRLGKMKGLQRLGPIGAYRSIGRLREVRILNRRLTISAIRAFFPQESVSLDNPES